MFDITTAHAVAGRTPFYLYDFEAVAQRVREVRTHLPGEVQIHYAIKANPMPALVQRIAPLVDGLDVASHGELQVALATGTDRARISIAGPGKSDDELTAALAAGVVVNVESAAELMRLRQQAEKLGVAPRFALRVNPDFQLSRSGMTMAGATPFGIDQARVGTVLADLGTEGLVGLHIFAGSQNLSLPALTAGVTETFRLAERLFDQTGISPEHLNIGGGLGIPYFPGEEPFSLAGYGSHLAKEVSRFHTSRPGTEVVMELGRYLVGEAGVYVCRVVERKESKGQVFLVTDGGLHHHLAASGNFGQVMRRNYPLSVVTATDGPEETVDVVGPLCTPLDVLGRKVTLPRCEPGDLVVVHQSGAYGLTASPTAFLGHRPPAELLL